jgi:uncharacterized protein (TIGR02268 family)
VLTLAALLVGTLAAAQPQPAPRERQVSLSREVVLAQDAAGPVPVVRVAPRARTYIVLDAPILPDSVRLEGDGTRVRLVAVSDSLIAVEGLTELGADGAVLRAHYADGNAPGVLSLSLVSDPAQVDKEVTVKRRPQSAAELEAELNETRARERAKDAELASLRARCEASGPLGFVLSGQLAGGLQQGLFAPDAEGATASGLAIGEGWVNAAPGWVVLTVEVRSEPGHAPWSPAPNGASLTSAKTGQPVKVRAVRLAGPALSAGEWGLLGIEAEPLPEGAGDVFRVEVRDATGRGFVLPNLKVEPPKASPQGDVKP